MKQDNGDGLREKLTDYPVVIDKSGEPCYNVMGHLVLVNPPPHDPDAEDNFHGTGWEREETDVPPGFAPCG